MAINEKNKLSPSFWTNLLTERVYNSVSNANAAAVRLQNFIVWIFAIYSTLTFAGVVWAKKEDWNPFALLIMGLSIALLIISYWYSVKATFPEPVEFLPGNEKSEREAYKQSVTFAQKYLKKAFNFCFIGTLTYCLAIVIQFGYTRLGVKAEKPAVKTTIKQPLEIYYKHYPKLKVITLNIRTVKKKQVLLSLETEKTEKENLYILNAYEGEVFIAPKMIFVDSTGNALVNVKYKSVNNLYIRAEITDTVSKAEVRRGILRKLVFAKKS